MNLESQVCSLELARKLKDLGVGQESLFWWYSNPEKNWGIMYSTYPALSDNYAAFTASELMRLLPNRITLEANEPFNSFTFLIKKSFTIKEMDDPEKINTIDNFIVNYECDTAGCSGEDAWLRRYFVRNSVIADELLSNALAKMLIHLIENFGCFLSRIKGVVDGRA